jgi:hypothetical protein
MGERKRERERFLRSCNRPTLLTVIQIASSDQVGSTTVSVALERMAERQSLKLCGRDQDFVPSLPCKVPKEDKGSQRKERHALLACILPCLTDRQLETALPHSPLL